MLAETVAQTDSSDFYNIGLGSKTLNVKSLKRERKGALTSHELNWHKKYKMHSSKLQI